MMFPTAVKGHIPFAPTYSERMDRQKQERRRRSSSSSDERMVKRKVSSSSAKQPKMHLAEQTSPKSTKGHLERRHNERYLRLSLTSDAQIEVSVAAYQKVGDLRQAVAVSEGGRKRATLFKSFVNLFRRRTRLSIDVHSDVSKMEQHAMDALGDLRLGGTACKCECQCAELNSTKSSAPNQSAPRRRRSAALRLESILEADDETESDDNEDDNDNDNDNDTTESDSAIDVREVDTSSGKREYRS